MIKGKEISNTRREKYLIFLILLSLYLSLAETLIPKPFPWLKLGLANIGTIIALEKFGKRMAVEVTLCRIIIQGIMIGTLFSPSFIISLISGIVSVNVMIFFYNFRNRLSLVSISTLSALAHNFVQLLVVYFLMFRNMNLHSRYIVFFIVGFLFLGCIAGAITGFIGEKLLLRRSCIK
ncbi:Gx transporter family protein [Fusobacterium sp.]|uniref:Gx transporter family protein n=1 Tax=Fusobacterium sp. TaxID=68766 RepID=UPI00262A5D29|nr:Gx transporter family protein [Fusobacterium sp.]